MYAYTPVVDLPSDNSTVSYLSAMEIAFDPLDSCGHGAIGVSYAQVMSELFWDELSEESAD
ncbi:MAG: hypothetical protein AB7E49_02780 [Campylobacterales bacterium]